MKGKIAAKTKSVAVQVDGIVILNKLQKLANNLEEMADNATTVDVALINLAKTNGVYRSMSVLKRHMCL